MNFYKFYTLLEGQAEDFVIQNPELQLAYNQGVKNINYLKWLLKNKEQPLEDIIPLIFAFEKNKTRLPIKDIFQYKNPNLLRQEIEKLGKSKSEISNQIKENETTKVGEFGDWIIVIPHTLESSCKWGKGTKWCTTSPELEKFIQYSIEKGYKGITFYLIKKNEDARKKPSAKLAITVDESGDPYLDSSSTVNARNNFLSKRSLKRALGDQYLPILSAIKKYTLSHNNEHPMEKQVKNILIDPNLLEPYLKTLQNLQKFYFLEIFLKSYNNLFSKEIFIKIMNFALENKNKPELDQELEEYGWTSEELSNNLLIKLANNEYAPIEVLIKLSKEGDANVSSAASKNLKNKSNFVQEN